MGTGIHDLGSAGAWRVCCVTCRWFGPHIGSVRKLLNGGDSAGINTLQTLDEETELSREQFKELLGTIDSGLRALPATAQVRLMHRRLLAGTAAWMLRLSSYNSNKSCPATPQQHLVLRQALAVASTLQGLCNTC